MSSAWEAVRNVRVNSNSVIANTMCSNSLLQRGKSENKSTTQCDAAEIKEMGTFSLGRQQAQNWGNN